MFKDLKVKKVIFEANANCASRFCGCGKTHGQGE